MIFIQVFSIFLVAIAIFSLLCKMKDQKEKFDIKKVLKIISLVLACVFVVRYMLGDEVIRETIKLENGIINNKILSLIAILLTWFNIASNLIIILFPFFEFKTQNNLVRIFSLVVSTLSFSLITPYTMGIVGVDAYTMFDLRTILLTIEVGITLGYSLFVFKDMLNQKITKGDLINILVVLVFVLLSTMPPYTLLGIFGNAKTVLEVKDLSSLHRVVMYMSIILPIILYVCLKNKPKEIVYYAMLYLSLGTLVSFSVDARFERFLDPTQWPLHLCNTAMYIIPLCIIFKMKKLFYFTYFINVFGAFIAMAMPNYSSGLNPFVTRILVFYINHYIAFFMPLLLVELDVFERPKLKQFKYSMVAFFVYFVLMIICNAWFSNYNADVDFFFLNSDFILEKLGTWALNLRNYTWEFSINELKFVFYPLYQILFFLTYVLLGLGMWFLYSMMYNIADHYQDMKARKQKIKLDEFAIKSRLGGNMQEPLNKEGLNKLIIKDFKKKYGQSEVYAVNGINLTINAGEIFGFLGPNGAGKSSTIKCLVGIQGLTEGEMSVNGYDVEKQSVEAKRQIGFVPDHYALYEKLTGREYVNYIADIYGVSQEDRDKSIEKYVNLFELKGKFDEPIRTYSHGMKQKITIIQALVHNPKLWVLDEPLTGLDPNSIFQVKECMKEHARNGNIVFFSSHIIDVVEKLCDKIAIIKKGEIVAVKDIKEITDSGISLEDYYLENINGTTDLLSLNKGE
ncbi:MAG: YwaF family protein [Clostridia bacterium]|nr:YwaF family protein [Clostridia bacterium]